MSKNPELLKRAPTDHLGVPLPIIPTADLLNLDTKSFDLTKHHEFYLYGPKRFGSIGGKAIRGARILRAQRDVHGGGSNIFHKLYNVSPGPLDADGQEDERGQFNIAVLSMAGYFPEKGIDLWSREPEERKMTEEEINILRAAHPTNESMYRNLIFHYETLRDFFAKFVEKQDLRETDLSVLEDFLSTPKGKLSGGAAAEVLHHAVHLATQPLESEYQKAREKGLLHPLASIKAERVVLGALRNNEQIRKKMYARLQRRALVAIPIAA